MESNTLIIAAAGSGKTTFLVKRALQIKAERVLITTYTEANEAEIKKRITEQNGYIPANIEVQTWFSFLLQHGVRPFQSALSDSIHERDIGFFLTSKKSGQKTNRRGEPIIVSGHPIYWGEEHCEKFYFTRSWRIYSDKIAKFVFECNKSTGGDVLNRLARIFDHVFVDEVQDLAGFDLELLKLLFRTYSTVLLVGDPRQVTYLTHRSGKHRKYSDGRIGEFVKNELGKKTKCTVDESTLKHSHRNNQAICEFSSRLYPELPASTPCTCAGCRPKDADHEGVFWIAKEDVDKYIVEFQPTQLRWSAKTNCSSCGPVVNFGEAKGLSFDRVLIYPTGEMVRWIKNKDHDLKNQTRAKLYVGLTRAHRSTAIVLDSANAGGLKGITRYLVD
ncbi:MAG: UvrD-helicase domain-containing protein [Proteobacteria bacterium]|jgi:DNA helicase-2/ATP-dependent DNA helicase PcrA|nr:UvrD-helicase domain-containing protein [Pseudomonadota bacterium]